MERAAGGKQSIYCKINWNDTVYEKMEQFLLVNSFWKFDNYYPNIEGDEMH